MNDTTPESAPQAMTLDEEIAHLGTLLRCLGDSAERMPAVRYIDMMGALIARKADLCRQRGTARNQIAHEGDEQWRA